MPKITVTNLATRDSVFSVIGKRDDVAERVILSKGREWITFELPNNAKCTILNQPREIIMVGSEHEIEVDEKGNIVQTTPPPQAQERTARIQLGGE